MYEDIIGTKQYLKDVEEEIFFQECSNCGHRFDCEPRFALDECGDRNEKWAEEIDYVG